MIDQQSQTIRSNYIHDWTVQKNYQIEAWVLKQKLSRTKRIRKNVYFDRRACHVVAVRKVNIWFYKNKIEWNNWKGVIQASFIIKIN